LFGILPSKKVDLEANFICLKAEIKIQRKNIFLSIVVIERRHSRFGCPVIALKYFGQIK